jgi:phosphoglucomutase
MHPNAITATLFASQIDSRSWPNGVAPAHLIHALAGKRGVERTGLRSVLTASGNLIHRGQGPDRRRRQWRIVHSPSPPRKRRNCCGTAFRRRPQLEAGSRRLSRGKTISNQVGSFFPPRENFRLTPEVETKFTEKLEHDPREFCGHEGSAGVRKDGLRRAFRDGSRVCHRFSETEPVVRVGGEARGDRGLEKPRAAAKRWIFEQKQRLEVATGKATRNSAFLYFLASRFVRMAQPEGSKFYRCHR